MPKIFISYRRDDSQYVIDGIHTELCKHFPEKDVFLDVQNIPLGVDFDIYLREQIEAHDVILVIIGNDWANIMKERANQDDDFVRIEIENALEQNKILIPILVKGAEMPDFSDLPDSIQGMRRKNNMSIRRKPDLTGDVKRLADGISEVMNFKVKRGTSVRMKQEPPPQQTEQPYDEHELRQMIKSKVAIERGKLGKSKPKTPSKPDKSILPDPFEWIHIPAGEVTLEAGGYIPKGGQTFAVDDFYIAKYPVTNAQYAVYVAETGKKPEYWDNLDFNQPLQPVVGVSWHDAIAYCDWLSQKLPYKVILPTEQQWQAAAQGNTGREYPWGNEWDDKRANTNRSVGKTTSVNHYPSGASPYGVLDMAGNVWEWCLTDYKIGANDTSGISVRIQRGSAFNSARNLARASYRHPYVPNFGRYDFGVRLVVAPILSEL